MPGRVALDVSRGPFELQWSSWKWPGWLVRYVYHITYIEYAFCILSSAITCIEIYNIVHLEAKGIHTCTYICVWLMYIYGYAYAYTNVYLCQYIWFSRWNSYYPPHEGDFFPPQNNTLIFLWSDWSCHMIILFWQWLMLLSWVLFLSKDSKSHPLHYCFFFIQNYVKLYSTWQILCWFQQFISVLQ